MFGAQAEISRAAVGRPGSAHDGQPGRV